MKTKPSSLAPILRSDTQGRIFAVLMVAPDDEHSIADLAQRCETTHPTVLREVDRAEAAGIVTSRGLGRTRLVRANPTHPLYEALARIILATYGPPAVLADALRGLGGVERAAIFGSWAARYHGVAGRWPNDIDVLVLGRPDRDDLFDAVERAERRLGMPVQVTMRTTAEWAKASAGDDPFLTEVRTRPVVELDLTTS